MQKDKMLETLCLDVSLFYQTAISCQRPVAMWRMPNGQETHAIVDLTGIVRPAKVDFCKSTPGFVFSPFVTNEAASQAGIVQKPQNAPLFIHADLHLTAQGIAPDQSIGHLDMEFLAGDVSTATSGTKKGAFQHFIECYRQLEHNAQHRPPELSDNNTGSSLNWFTSNATGYHHGVDLRHADTTDIETSETENDVHDTYQGIRTKFRNLVNSAINFIETSGIRKVVVSRKMSKPLPNGFDPVEHFYGLCQRYNHAFVSLVAIPGIGTWIGASPEVLLQVDETSLFTMALAATQAKPKDAPLDTVQWGAKEVEEQALVSHYIRDFFNNAGIEQIQESGPRTVSAGNVVHLQTEFRVDLPRYARMMLANRVLNELHPTSAVCGMPKDKALSFILAHEDYDRSFYSGFLGPIHVNGDSGLYVNLRCMQLQSRTATLYMGVGVTADSQPEAEWRETELKAETLLAVLE
ncbi:MAG: chorismate-binding protein [Chloroflexota bacterium]